MDAKKLLNPGKKAFGMLESALDSRTKELIQVAAAHGFAYVGRGDRGELAVEGMLLDIPGNRESNDVVELTGDLSIQVGNNGWKYGPVDDDLRPSRRGYIAIQHRLEVPHMLAETIGFGAKSVLNVGSAVLRFASGWSSESDPDSPIASFGRDSEKLPLPKDSGFRARCEKDGIAAGSELLTPEALRIMSGSADSFDIEIRSGWVLIYSNYGDLVTRDTETWDWVLSSASRVVDLLRLWGAGPEWAHGWEHYSQEWVERPRKLGGALSPRRWSKD